MNNLPPNRPCRSTAFCVKRVHTPELENRKASIEAAPQCITRIKYFRTNMVFSGGENEIT